MHKPSSPILTEATTQQWLDWCHTFRLLVFVLRERSTVRGLKGALDKGARMWNKGMKSQDTGDAMVGVEECLLVSGNLRESTSGVGDCSTAPILFGHSGDYDSAGNRPGSKWWRMAHPSSNDGDDGSGQRVWTNRWRALRHFASDRVADEKLMERDSVNLGDNRNVSKDLAFMTSGRACGRTGRTPTVIENDCESGSKGSQARYTNRTDGASCFGGPCEPGMLADVVGWAVPRPAVESVCRDGAIQLLTLLEEALMAVETCARSTSERRMNGPSRISEPLREQAQMAVALKPLSEESRTT